MKPKKRTVKTKTIGIRVTPLIKKELEERASQQERPVSYLVQKFIKEGLQRLEEAA